MIYGHLDKQPPTEGWFTDQGIYPYYPVIKDGKLYGRGGADDGYSIFAAISSVKALQEQNVPHSRVVVIIEACEESGSKVSLPNHLPSAFLHMIIIRLSSHMTMKDLPFYIEKLKEKIGSPSLIICLDSGCGNYEQVGTHFNFSFISLLLFSFFSFPLSGSSCGLQIHYEDQLEQTYASTFYLKGSTQAMQGFHVFLKKKKERKKEKKEKKMDTAC